MTPKTQYEFGGYGMHMESTPGAVVGLEDGYTDWAVDFQIDRTLFRKDVLSLRGTYIRENSTLAATYAAMGAQVSNHHLDTVFANAEYHFGNRLSGTFGWFDTGGTVDPLLYAQSAVSGSANGNPRGAGYIANFSFFRCRICSLASNIPDIPVSTAPQLTMMVRVATRVEIIPGICWRDSFSEPRRGSADLRF